MDTKTTSALRHQPSDIRRVYISGPISGRQRTEYMSEFRKAEAAVRCLMDEGRWNTTAAVSRQPSDIRIVNPTRLAPCRWPWLYRLLGYRLTLRYDLWHLRRCQVIAIMPGHELSRGARLERMKAHQWGLDVVRL